MIRNDTGYRKQQEALAAQDERMAQQEQALEKEGLSGDEVTRAMDPIRSFRNSLQEELELYERLREKKSLDVVSSLKTLGLQLIALRIYCGMTQRELAERLGVDESQISRDERHEYHGITEQRAATVLDALGIQMLRTYSVEPQGQNLANG